MTRDPRSTAATPASDDELEEAIRAARLIGADPALVLHGGGNTSLKSGAGPATLLHVKCSGADLATATRHDYVTLWLAPVRELLTRPALDNPSLYPALAPLIIGPVKARPSIETLMHAGLDAPHVMHTHAASILALSNCVDDAHHLAAALQGRAALVPYRHSGADLARACVDAQARMRPGTIGMVLSHHGAVSWGGSALEARERMLWLRDAADAYLETRGAVPAPFEAGEPGHLSREDLLAIARLRSRTCAVAGRRLVARFSRDGLVRHLLSRPDLADFSRRGPATPGHAIHTKHHPLLGDDVEAFARAYRAYLGGATGVDCGPRIVLDPATGMLAFGVTARHARIADEIFRNDARIMLQAQALGGYRTIDAQAMRTAEIEYAGFEARIAAQCPRAGEVHVVDRARERVDRIERLLSEGAAVIAVDAPESLPATDACLPLASCAGAAQLAAMVARAVRRFGGIDACAAAAPVADACKPFLELAHA